ncbi:hypothetical protein NCC49_006224 [Naganishia albida]|nr:hypothetical protein NCC49_006224 [Naganishia albida]
MADVRTLENHPSGAPLNPPTQNNIPSIQPASAFGQVTGAGLGSSPNVQSLPKASGGEGMTRAELAEKKAKEAAEKAKADGPGQTFQKEQE